MGEQGWESVPNPPANQAAVQTLTSATLTNQLLDGWIGNASHVDAAPIRQHQKGGQTMFAQDHRARDAAASVPPRPAFSDNLLSGIPMSGAASDLSAMAMIAWSLLEASGGHGDAQKKEASQ